MKTMLEQGDKVKIIPTEQLFELLKRRNFCSDDETRKRVSDAIGGKEGIVKSIEEKWAFDYFYFTTNSSGMHYSIPYESVDFSELSK